jgi:tetrahydromethanopterin S-methyltransferase subunit H
MFRFEKDQRVHDFNGTRIGGQPGEYPTVLAASIFYNKHEIVTDHRAGIFDEDAAEALWLRCLELSDETAIPHIIQIIAESPAAFERYITWFETVDPRTAFLMDSSVPEARMHAASFVTEVGLADRAIYNSINGSIVPAEIAELKESAVDTAILLAFNPGNPTVAGREKVLAGGGVAGQEKSMLGIAAECGITRPILDTAATPLGLGSGGAYREILAAKALHGLPTGGAYHNMTVSWPWLRRRREEFHKLYEGREILRKQMLHHYREEFEALRQAVWTAPDTGCNLIAGTLGADLIMYGQIEHCEPMITAQALADIAVLEATRELGIDAKADHPFFRLL